MPCHSEIWPIKIAISTNCSSALFSSKETPHLAMAMVIVDTLSKTTPSTGRGGQFFQLITLLPGNTYQLKELAATSC